jgi:hypothetical protein
MIQTKIKDFHHDIFFVYKGGTSKKRKAGGKVDLSFIINLTVDFFSKEERIYDFYSTYVLPEVCVQRVCSFIAA